MAEDEQPEILDDERREEPILVQDCEATGFVSDLPDMRGKSLLEMTEAELAAFDATLARIAPHDGSRVLLVAASFNSAI